jgi:hypothetical protein
MGDIPETRRSAVLSILAYHGWMADDGTDIYDARLVGALYWLPLMEACT